MSDTRLLEVNNLKTVFETEDGVVRAVDESSFVLDSGETLGIVGESGSGKTVTMLSLMRLIENPGRIAEGQILFRGQDLLAKTDREMQRIRGNDISMVFQDSLSSLNPTMKIGDQIGRVLAFHTSLTRKQRLDKAVELLRQLNIPEPLKRVQNYPHELSGGMRQRILIAMAIACNPSLLILDEPTTALDVTIEAQIFELVDQLQAEYEMGTVLITHDLSVVASSCSRVIIMYAGKIVEEAPVMELYDAPQHPYTRCLLQSIPKLDQAQKEQLFSIPGEVPDLIGLEEGCTFAPRCAEATEECFRTSPRLRAVDGRRRVACLQAGARND
jgi:oligopeptide/dipeptide ABC transporter ATP-binding protein